MKYRAGKMKRPGTALLPQITERGIELIDLQTSHLVALDGLAMYHSDPFDHLILSQAKAEGATLVTSDERMDEYGTPFFMPG